MFYEIATLFIMFLNTDEFNMGNQSMTSSNLNLPSNYRDLTDLLLINRRTCAHRATDFQMDLSRVRNKTKTNPGVWDCSDLLAPVWEHMGQGYPPDWGAEYLNTLVPPDVMPAAIPRSFFRRFGRFGGFVA